MVCFFRLIAYGLVKSLGDFKDIFYKVSTYIALNFVA